MLAAVIAVLAIIADQVTKYIVVANIEYKGSVPFIPGFMSFFHTRNTGAAFSMFSDQRWVYMVFSFISMGLIIFMLVKEYKRHRLLNIALAMVLGGGIGNMIDRIRLGYVVDFFKTEFMDFAVFNVADCFITVGAVLLGVYVIFFEPRVEKRLKAEKAALAAATECATAETVAPVTDEKAEPITEEKTEEAVKAEITSSEENSENG
ncbi:MAG: signal peptidase II [Clostridia bacterium]|nr:signal peptidase II [Clostridia bacterium]